MGMLLHVVTYASLLVFVLAIMLRFWRIRSYPLHIRWEIHPIPHEGKRSEHGGSKMEDTDWWTKEHKPDMVNELRFMIPEMLFLKALFEHNRKLWLRSFPFHFGLYLLAGFVGLLVLGALLELGNVAVGVEASGLGKALAVLTAAVGALGLALALAGTAGLLLARLTDADLKPHTNFSHIFNLLVFLVVLVLAALAFSTVDDAFSQVRAFIGNLVVLNLSAGTGSVLLDWTVGLTALLVAYIPLTHMSHFFVKWFTWHKIRWDDEENVRGGRIEKMIQQALSYPVTWSADHIKGDGKKTWADVATEEIETSE